MKFGTLVQHDKTHKKVSWTHNLSPTGSRPFWIKKTILRRLHQTYFNELVWGIFSQQLQNHSVSSQDLQDEKLSKTFWITHSVWPWQPGEFRHFKTIFEPSLTAQTLAPPYRLSQNNEIRYTCRTSQDAQKTLLEPWPKSNRKSAILNQSTDSSPFAPQQHMCDTYWRHEVTHVTCMQHPNTVQAVVAPGSAVKAPRLRAAPRSAGVRGPVQCCLQL